MTSAAAADHLPDGGRFVALDSLRGIAALLVAAFHVQGTGPVFGSAFVRSGALAVDFFFVLSGFVIAASYGARLADGFPLRRYALLRLGRIYPLHVAMLLAFVAVELTQWLVQMPGLIAREPFTGGHSLAQLGLTVVLLHGFAVPPASDWNLPSWSIAIEIWLYLAIALAWRAFGRRGWFAAGLAALGAGWLLAMYPHGLFTPLSQEALRGVLGFGIGICLWQLWRGHAWPRPRVLVATALETLALALAAAVFLVPNDFPGSQTIVALIFALVVYTFAAQAGLLSRLLTLRPFVWLGILSYSIYMVHGFVIGRGKDVARLAGLRETTDWLGLALLAAAIAAAYITWWLIEEPCRLWSRRRAARMGAAREEADAPTF